MMFTATRTSGFCRRLALTAVLAMAPPFWAVTAGSAVAATCAGDDYGNGASTAQVIAPNSTTASVINCPGDEDWFRITLPTAGDLTLYTTGGTDTYGYLLKSDGSEIAHDDDGDGFPNFRMQQFVDAGTYYVRVRHYSPDYTGPYTLVLQFKPAFRLQVSVIGNGTVTSDKPGIDGLIKCPGKCIASFKAGTGVTVTAIPASGFYFAGWTGSCGGTAPTCALTMDGDRSTAATFKTVGSQPDLIVTSMSPSFSASGYGYAYVNVKNIGGGTANPSTLTVRAFGGYSPASASVLVPKLDSGKDWSGLVSMSYSDIMGYHVCRSWGASGYVTAYADDPRQVAESNENNNTLSVPYTCH